MPASPEALGASDNVTTGPPAMSILLSASCAKKAMERPSGDQNGYEAPSVPCKSRDVSVSSGRTQIWIVPDASLAVNARRVPSGDTMGANPGCPLSKMLFSGGRTLN